MPKVIGPSGDQFLDERKICPELASRFGIYTAKSGKGGQVIADPTGSVVVFPYFEHGVVVNEKYRGPGKTFWQQAGGKRTFWNADILDDPSLIEGQVPLVITEGELDAITAIACGFPHAVSVPDGAPAGSENVNDPLDAGADATGKFEFIWNNRDRLARIKRFVLAVDADRPGQHLATELLRRLSAARCSFVTYPGGCKDLNDVLMAHGPAAVARVINSAKPYPVRGLYRLGDYPEHETLRTYRTGWETLDPHLRLFAGEFMVITGVPSHGKSTWMLNLIVHAANLHGWKTALFSPEMPTVPHLRDRLRRIKTGRAKSFDPSIDAWIEDNFVFIDADPTDSRQDENFTLDWILDRATDAVLRDGVQALVIDPWNEIEHARAPGEMLTDYVARSIRALKRFARLRNVAVIVVAHPTKDVWREGKTRIPTLYDIESSAHWFNKCDHGVVVWRGEGDQSKICIAKSRFEEAGERGEVNMRFDRISCRYLLLDAER